LLWPAPARDWYAGRPPRPARQEQTRERPEPAPRSRPEEPLAPRPDLSAPPAALPRPTRAYGRPGGVPDFPPPAQPPVHPTLAPPAPATPVPPAAAAGTATPPARVRIACWITWICTAVTGVGALASIVVVLLNQDTVIDEVTSSDAWDRSMDSGLIVPATITLAAIVVLWCAAAAVLAVFAWRRQTWAWTLLVVFTGVAALFSMFLVPRSAAHLVATALCLGMLLNREVRAWYAAAPTAEEPPRPW
jgi:hypothetical protein